MAIAKDSVLKADKNKDFEENGKFTLLGWLIELYLYPPDKDGYIPINSKQHRTDYERSLSVLRKLAGLNPKTDLLEWECTLSQNKAHTLLNKIIKEMNSGKKKKKVSNSKVDGVEEG